MCRLIQCLCRHIDVGCGNPGLPFSTTTHALDAFEVSCRHLDKNDREVIYANQRRDSSFNFNCPLARAIPELQEHCFHELPGSAAMAFFGKDVRGRRSGFADQSLDRVA
jgi:hypothetical protein